MPDQDTGSPIRSTDDAARALARQLIAEARFAALAALDPKTGSPMVSRVAFGTDPNGIPVTLVSDLSHHTVALRHDARCSLLIGEPGDKGDPLTHPRMTLIARARFLERQDEGHADLRAHYLLQHPKARLYIDFADFNLVRFDILQGQLNGGFGKAYSLWPQDLGLP